MRRVLVATVGLAATAVVLSGCNPARVGERRNEKPFAVAARLDCPAQQGALRLKQSSADGRSCRYVGDDGEQVELRTVALNGRNAQDALAAVEQELRGAVPDAPGGAKRADAAKSSDDGDEDTAVSADANGLSVSTDRSGKGDRAHIDLPGFHVDADGDRAEVRLPGIHINADGDKADVQVDRPGGRLASVHADDGGAEVHTGDIGPKNVDAAFILASDKAGPDGAKTAGYVARGPINGPLVVALQTGPGDRDHHDGDNDGFRDARALVKHNVTRAR